MTKEILIADIETNGFQPNEIFVVGIINLQTDKFDAYYGEQIPYALIRLANAHTVIGHNFRQFDAVQIRKLSDGLIDLQQNQIVDTLEFSRELFPQMDSHSLDTWGEILQFPKGSVKSFKEFSPELIPYCERDCRLTKMIFEFLSSHGNRLKKSIMRAS